MGKWGISVSYLTLGTELKWTGKHRMIPLRKRKEPVLSAG